MGMMTRMLRLFKADLHGVMDQLENQQLLMRQYVREMQTALRKKEDKCARLLSTLTQLEAVYRHLLEECDKLEMDLSLAIDRQKDDIARSLIRKQLANERKAQQMERRLANLRREHAALTAEIDTQRNQYEQLKAEVDGLCARMDENAVETECPSTPFDGWKAPTDEEIELALMRRKEARQKGVKNG